MDKKQIIKQLKLESEELSDKHSNLAIMHRHYLDKVESVSRQMYDVSKRHEYVLMAISIIDGYEDEAVANG